MATEIERADAIRWIRAQTLDCGLTMEELDASGCWDCNASYAAANFIFEPAPSEKTA